VYRVLRALNVNALARLSAVRGGLVAGAMALLSACAGQGPATGPVAGGPPAPGAVPSQNTIGNGQVKVGLILPLTAPGNAGLVAQSMKNSAELALAEFNSPNITLLVKDDGGTSLGAQQAAQQALDEGAELILGPLFAQSVQAVGGVARTRGVPVIAFSTDTSVATRGVNLLSFLPESDVNRIVNFAMANGKKSFAAIMQDNAYGVVIEAAFKEAVARRGGRVINVSRYELDQVKMQTAVKAVAQSADQTDAILIADGPDIVPTVAQMLVTNGVNTKKVQLLGTGLWDDQRIFSDTALAGGWYPAPDPAGFQNFSNRYRQKYGQDPVRTATLSYDATALVAALVKTQGGQRFTPDVLTSGSGFAGIDGVFRFRQDGTNERGLAVFRVSPSGGQPISPAPKSFGASGGAPKSDGT
jgi:ABC-type branched-subunit amino acid transport system substrate-binding protein